MNLLDPFFFRFYLRERFEVFYVGILARHGVAQPAVDMDTGPLRFKVSPGARDQALRSISTYRRTSVQDDTISPCEAMSAIQSLY